MKGGNPLLATSTAIRSRLRDGDIPSRDGDSTLATARQLAELAKWASIYVLSVAAETFHVKVADEQEILGAIADMIIQTYAIDSTVARVGTLREPLAEDVVAAFVPRAFDSIVQTGRHVVADIADEKSLPVHLEALDRLRVVYPAGVLAAKRRIAAAVRDVGGYPFDRVA
jgi:butyryl-CoA dehydrogenase